jgi:hypothetical protein
VRVNAHPGDASCAGMRVDCRGDLWVGDFGFDELGRTNVCDECEHAERTCEVGAVDHIFGCTSEGTLDLLRCAHGTAQLDGELRYHFDVADGRYVVNLYFAVSQTPDDADVFIGGRRVAEALEIDDDAEGGVVVRSFVADVRDDNGISIALVADGARAIVSAVEVLRMR